MTDEEYQIRRKYENRNLMQELDWVAHYPPNGMSNQDRDFIKWLAMTAYDKINELEQTSVPVHDMELILDEVTKPQWIPVTERLPCMSDEVLVCTEDYGKTGLGFVTVAVLDWTGWLDAWERKTYLTAVTHWMPLPEPPKEAEND